MGSGAFDVNHDVAWTWPLLGIPDPASGAALEMSGPENTALSVYHRGKAALKTAMKAASEGTPSQSQGSGASGSGAAPDSGAALTNQIQQISKSEIKNIKLGKSGGKGKDQEK